MLEGARQKEKKRQTLCAYNVGTKKKEKKGFVLRKAGQSLPGHFFFVKVTVEVKKK